LRLPAEQSDRARLALFSPIDAQSMQNGVQLTTNIAISLPAGGYSNAIGAG
jgi:hypothetical protein